MAFIGGIAFKLYHIPIFSQLADEAESTSETEFFALSRVCTSLGMILATGIFIFMLGVGDRIAFQTIFLIAALATLTIPMMESRL